MNTSASHHHRPDNHNDYGIKHGGIGRGKQVGNSVTPVIIELSQMGFRMKAQRLSAKGTNELLLISNSQFKTKPKYAGFHA